MKPIEFVIYFSVVLLLIAGCDIIIPPEIPPKIIYGDGSALQKDFIDGQYIVVLLRKPAHRNARAETTLDSLTKEIKDEVTVNFKPLYDGIISTHPGLRFRVCRL